MHFNKTLIALAVFSNLFPLHAAQADEIAKTERVDRVLAPVTATVDREVEVQARTELGKLTEYTPISGAVVEREELEHLNLVNNLLELGKRVPGFSMVRNMRIPDGGKNYTENRVDGLRVSSTSNTSLLDEVDGANIERLEVITGPGSALYGSGALGGTISVTTRMPPKEFDAKLSQEVGSWGFTRTGGNVGKTSEDGRIGFLLNASTMDNDGWRRNVVSGEKKAAEEHKDGVAFRTQIRASDTTKLILGADRLRYDYHLAGALPFNATEAAKLKDATINGVNLRDVYWDKDWQPSVPGTDGRTDHTFQTFSANLQQLIGARGELTLTLSQRTDEGNDAGAAGSGGSRSVICDNVTVTCATYNTKSAASTNTIKKGEVVVKSARPMYRQEFDLAKSTLYVGMELIDVESDAKTYNNSYTAAQAQRGMWALGTMTATGQGNITQERNETPFIHYEFSPIDKLRLHIGERFDKITYSVNDRTTANKDGERTFKDNVSKAGATYDLVKDHLLWLSRAETFNAPGSSSFLDSAATGTAGNVIGTNLKPEDGLTHEIGFRGLFSNIGLRYDIAVYHSDSKGFINTRDCTADEAARLNGGADCDIRENLGGLTTKGVESVFNWAANEWLDIGATYVNAQALYHDDNVGATAGKSYMYMPRERLNLRVAVKPAPKWTVELEYDHISRYFYDTANTQTYSRPDLFSLRTSYRSKNWSFWLHALNLTDQKYTTRVGNGTIAGVSVLTAQAGQGNSGTYTPLSLRAGLSYTF